MKYFRIVCKTMFVGEESDFYVKAESLEIIDCNLIQDCIFDTCSEWMDEETLETYDLDAEEYAENVTVEVEEISEEEYLENCPWEKE